MPYWKWFRPSLNHIACFGVVSYGRGAMGVAFHIFIIYRKLFILPSFEVHTGLYWSR